MKILYVCLCFEKIMKTKCSFFPLLSLLILLICIGCKSHQDTGRINQSGKTVATDTPPASGETPKTTGRVSHAYQPCGSVIIVTNSKNDTTVLIVGSSLNEFDVDGLEISFHYKPLKRMNPKGCNKGYPAVISDITKK
jgi:hypothetical protein